MATAIKDNGRLNHLDSIRGIAACVVVMFHCWLLTSDAFRNSLNTLSTALHSVPDLVLYGLEKVLRSGHPAVMVFFVLSGFVLACSLGKKQTPYVGYAVKRFFRIYPVFIVAVLASYVLHSLIGVQHEVN